MPAFWSLPNLDQSMDVPNGALTQRKPTRQHLNKQGPYPTVVLASDAILADTAVL